MKSKKNLLEQLKPLPHFNKNVVYQLGKQLELKDSTINTYISRFLKYGDILQFKNGLYVTADFFEKNRSDISYSFYLANIIRTPSYVSSWAALQYYNLVTEAVYPITSITLKVTREYRTKAGNFAYQSIKKDFFSDYKLYLDLLGNLSEILQIGTNQLDLTDLAKANILLRYETTSRGKLLYGDEDEYTEFKAFAFRDYIDAKPLFELEDILIKKRQELIKQAT